METLQHLDSAIMDSAAGSQKIEFTLTAIPDELEIFLLMQEFLLFPFLKVIILLTANYGSLIELKFFSILMKICW